MRAPEWLTARPVAHRGLHDRARGIVENMPSAIIAAVDRNFAIEVDVQLSSDGEAMVHHDYVLGRLNEGDADLSSLTSAQLRQVQFKDTSDRMMTLGDLCDLVAGKVPLVVEIKSRFKDDRQLLRRTSELLTAYKGPAAAMSFDPDQVLALKEIAPQLPRGIVAQRDYDDGYWTHLSVAQRREMTHLRHAFRTRPHFVAFAVNDLPSPAPWVARHLFGCSLLTWTVRTAEQRATARRHADQMIFEGFLPDA
jgi:glycerophosphoryl diester phosphodiesterase